MPIVFKPDFRLPKRRGKPPEVPGAPVPPVYGSPSGAPPPPVPPPPQRFGCGCGAGWVLGAYSVEAVCWTLRLLLDRLVNTQDSGHSDASGLVSLGYGVLHLGMMFGWVFGGILGLQLFSRKPGQERMVGTLTGIGLLAGGLVGYFVGEALVRAAGGGTRSTGWCAIEPGIFAGLFPATYALWYGFLGGGLMAGAGLVAAALRRPR